MNDIKRRVGKSLTVTLPVYTNKVPKSLVGRDIKLIMTTPLLRNKMLEFEIVEGYKLRFSMREEMVGTYTFTVQENWEDDNKATCVDYEGSIELVSKTYLENDSKPEGLDVEEVNLSCVDMEVISSAGIYSKSIRRIEVHTLESYEALPVKDERTLYVIK